MNPLLKVALVCVLLEVLIVVLSPLINLFTPKGHYHWLGFITIGLVGVICGVFGGIIVVLAM